MILNTCDIDIGHPNVPVILSKKLFARLFGVLL